MTEKLKEPCCEKCGQSLPTPPPLTISERIERLSKEIASAGILGRHLRRIFSEVVEILRELEKRPSIQFTPTLPPNAIGGTGIWPAPTIQPPFPTPFIGDPPYDKWPTVTCRNTAEKTTQPMTCPGVIDPEQTRPLFVTGMTVARRVFNDAPAGSAVSDPTGYSYPDGPDTCA